MIYQGELDTIGSGYAEDIVGGQKLQSYIDSVIQDTPEYHELDDHQQAVMCLALEKAVVLTTEETFDVVKVFDPESANDIEVLENVSPDALRDAIEPGYIRLATCLRLLEVQKYNDIAIKGEA